MAIKVTIPHNGWRPRPDQMPLWLYLFRGGKRAVEVAHRRWGKDDVALHFTATQAVQSDRIGNYWHMLPEYGQARKAIWDAVNPRTGKRRIDEAFPAIIRDKTREQDMFIKFKSGSTWQLVGSDNYHALVGSPPRGVIFSEWALADPMCWPYIQPILEENNGWAAFISTSRGMNHMKTMVDHAMLPDNDWFGEILKATDTPVFTQAQLDNIRKELISTFGDEHGEALFNQEYMSSFQGAIMGAYFAKQMNKARDEKRITNVPWQPGHEVDTFWDLGVDDSMTIWFMQPIGKEFHFIDYYEGSGYGLEHYAKVMKEKPYVYGNHFMPHDAAAREMTNNEIALSRKEVAENLGIRPVVVVERVRNMDILVQRQIPAARNILASCWFDARKCAHGIDALDNYRAKYDEEKKILSSRPTHGWESHGSSAFLTFAVGYKPKVSRANVLSAIAAHKRYQPASARAGY